MSEFPQEGLVWDLSFFLKYILVKSKKNVNHKKNYVSPSNVYQIHILFKTILIQNFGHYFPG